MAHQLTIRREGKVEMAYTGERPWHGLGTKLPDGSSTEDWIAAAGMDWEIRASPVQYLYEDEVVTTTDRRVLHRSDTGGALGIVSTGYHPVQPRDTIEFFRDLIEGLGLTMSTAGTLFGGRKFWALGYIGEEAVVDDRDLVRGHLLLATSADGTMATTGRYTTTRVVCDNTLRMGLNSSVAAVRTIHSTKFNPEAAKKEMGLAPKTFQEFMGRIRDLARTPVTTTEAEELTKELAGEGPVSERIMELFAGEAIGSELTGAEGSAWGWLNAVTQFVDHERKAKSDSHRLNSALLGSGDRMKVRALELV